MTRTLDSRSSCKYTASIANPTHRKSQWERRIPNHGRNLSRSGRSRDRRSGILNSLRHGNSDGRLGGSEKRSCNLYAYPNVIISSLSSRYYDCHIAIDSDLSHCYIIAIDSDLSHCCIIAIDSDLSHCYIIAIDSSLCHCHCTSL